MGYIGLDIGGTNVRYCFADISETTILNCQKIPFLKTGDPHTEVEKNICSIINMMDGSIEGIGISLAAIMDRNTGKVKIWPNNPCWNCYELVKHLSNRYNVPIIIEDDANCGAIGEYYALASPTPFKNIAYITIGTGIGCGLILNGSLFIGENGFAGELGHVWIDDKENERICNCGNKGCLQSVTSGPAVLKEYNLMAKANLKSLRQVYKKYMQHDICAVKCLSNMIDYISKVVYNLVMCLDISVFLIGGGVGNMSVEFIANIKTNVNKRLIPFKREVSVEQAQLGEFSSVYGALQLLKNSL